jgi:ribonuclease HII
MKQRVERITRRDNSFSRAGSLSVDRLRVKVTGVIAFKGMRVIGIDEAGYGPLLGPLVVTAVSIECTKTYSPEEIWEAIGRDWGIADSKMVLSHRNMARGELTTMALLACLGIAAETRQELFRSVVVDLPLLGEENPEGSPDLPAYCERSWHTRACLPDSAALPRWGLPALAERVEDLRSRLAQVGVRLRGAEAALLCPGRFNRAIDRGLNKAEINWQLFAHLLRRARPWLASEGLAPCGKLGGRSRYGALLADLGISSVIEESRARSAYFVEGLGQVEFLRSAEAAHPPVAMASMIGKLLREHVLDQWHGALVQHLPDLDTCSGYRDASTNDYVERTRSLRAQLCLPDDCFLRKK